MQTLKPSTSKRCHLTSKLWTCPQSMATTAAPETALIKCHLSTLQSISTPTLPSESRCALVTWTTLDGFGTKTHCTSSTDILCPRFSLFLFTLCSSLAKPLYLKDLVGCSGTRMKLMFLSSPCLFWTIRPKPLKKSCSMREAKVDTKWNVNVKCEYKTRKMKWRYRLQVVIFKFSTSVTEFQAFESQ